MYTIHKVFISLSLNVYTLGKIRSKRKKDRWLKGFRIDYCESAVWMTQKPWQTISFHSTILINYSSFMFFFVFCRINRTQYYEVKR